MQSEYLSDKIFENINFSEKPILKGEFETCVFKRCNFSSVNLSECRFSECKFNACDLSNANISMTAFQDVEFKDCKILGLQFQDANHFAFSLKCMNCQLDHASFFKVNLQECIFVKCRMIDCDFTEADLRKLDLVSCDLLDARFERSNLVKTDFREAINYSIDPNNNSIEGAKFTSIGALGLLDTFNIEID
jgi:uncharacterized protein YjbI with pentapeptide repeats